MDPDGLPWEDAYAAAVMAECSKRVPPRQRWIEEYRTADEAGGWDAVAGI